MFRPRYFFGETFTGMRRNFLMFFTAITTVAITLFIVGFFLIVIYDIQGILTSIKSQVEVAVYLKDNITDELKTYLENEIKGWDEVAEITFVSKEQALEKFRKENEGSEILKEIQGNPLPASFELELKSPEKVEQIALRFLDKDGNFIEGVDEVIYGQNYVQKLFQITAITGSIAFLIIIMLLLATVVLIFNTIRLSIHARRKEIEVMKLVGATNWFVRIPFIFEGFFEGFIGSIISVILLYFMANYLLIRGEKAIVDTMHIKELAILGSNNVIIYIYAGLIILGGLIGIFSSSFALKRYIRV
ncbi:MAG: ABC transporter permease [Actinobacteria bacterium]|nr:ABC transporter permease [Actinomycetota bacterium]MBM3712796.1 ABC transporter permease [Actinomycetota bacterium]